MEAQETGGDKKFLRELRDIINWYDKKAIQYKKCNEIIMMIKMACAILISLLAVITSIYRADFTPIVTAAVAGVFTFLEALSNLKQFEKMHIIYRNTCEALIIERRLFESGTEPYDKEGLNAFVVKCHEIFKETNKQWLHIQQSAQNPAKP